MQRFSRLSRLAAVPAILSGLAACTSTETSTGNVVGSSLGVPIVAGAPPPPGSATIQPPISGLTSTPPPFGGPHDARPQNAIPTYERTTSAERTSVGADGTVRTDRTTTRVGFDPNRAAVALAALSAPRAAQGSIAGPWQMQSSSSGSMCSVYLYGDSSSTSGSASSSGCPVGGIISGVSGWSYANNQLTLSKGGTTAMVLNQMSPNRFDGTATWGFLSTRISLYR